MNAPDTDGAIVLPSASIDMMGKDDWTLQPNAFERKCSGAFATLEEQGEYVSGRW